MDARFGGAADFLGFAVRNLGGVGGFGVFFGPASGDFPRV